MTNEFQALEAQQTSLMQLGGLLSCDINLATYWWNTTTDLMFVFLMVNVKRCPAAIWPFLHAASRILHKKQGHAHDE